MRPIVKRFPKGVLMRNRINTPRSVRPKSKCYSIAQRRDVALAQDTPFKRSDLERPAAVREPALNVDKAHY